MAAEASVDPARWPEIFDELMGQIAGRFGRVEPRRRARAFVLGLGLEQLVFGRAVVGDLPQVIHQAQLVGAVLFSGLRRVIVAPDLERFARDIQRHTPARAPVTPEFLPGYPAAQLHTVRRFTADLAAAPAPTEPTT